MQGNAMDATREAQQAAAALSRGCPECGGSGQTSRFVWMLRNDTETEVPVGCLCYLCDLGAHYHERRALGEKCFRRFLPLALPVEEIRRQFKTLSVDGCIKHEIFRHPEETRIWLSQRDAYCNPKPLDGNQATNWWNKYKTRLARANKERRNEPGKPQSSQNGPSSPQDASEDNPRVFAQAEAVSGTLAP